MKVLERAVKHGVDHHQIDRGPEVKHVVDHHEKEVNQSLHEERKNSIGGGVKQSLSAKLDRKREAGLVLIRCRENTCLIIAVITEHESTGLGHVPIGKDGEKQKKTGQNS